MHICGLLEVILQGSGSAPPVPPCTKVEVAVLLLGCCPPTASSTSPDVLACLLNVDMWSFDVFALNDASGDHALKFVFYEMLTRYDLINRFKVPVSALISFVDSLEVGYSKHKNPYHNLMHAADVTQTIHYLLLKTGMVHWLTELEIFAIIFAAAIHDYEHTGTTNNFHIQTRSDTAMLYNDRAVLENHHVSAAYRLLQDDDERNILSNLSKDDWRELRTLVVEMVLATDMSCHFQQIKAMKSLLQQPEAIDKPKALSLLLHTADISHPAKRWDLHHRWTKSLLEEFFRQTLLGEVFLEGRRENKLCPSICGSDGKHSSVKSTGSEGSSSLTTVDFKSFKVTWNQEIRHNRETWKAQAAKDLKENAKEAEDLDQKENVTEKQKDSKTTEDRPNTGVEEMKTNIQGQEGVENRRQQMEQQPQTGRAGEDNNPGGAARSVVGSGPNYKDNKKPDGHTERQRRQCQNDPQPDSPMIHYHPCKRPSYCASSYCLSLVRGLGRRGPPPRLLPKPHCTGPSWTFLRVVSLLEGGPTSPFQAEPGRVPWAKTRPPGARLRAPNPRPGSRVGPR
ncbi:hypothetical protein L3Q82_004510 [Scortum barcoo]|uniref:Uncharacterized protein n=1 Tax=Scortum barcoo TaxID=214431 RepID=A0ACB8VGY1_9TELE|nr:hypothetical protein L3Q82_004510 [Scortum barcoo]